MNQTALLQDARRYLGMLHKRRGILATLVGTSLLIAVLYNYTTRPVYQATTQILIDRDTPNLLPTKEIVDMGEGGADYFQTQFELLRGRRLAEAVVEKLDLQKNPEFQQGPLMSPWERIQRRFFGKAPASALDSDGMPLSPAIAALRSRLTVERLRGSRIVSLKFNAYDPALAANAANTLASLYMQQTLDIRYTRSSEATDWLGARLADQEKKVQEAERGLQAYREREKLVNVEERQALVDQKLSSLNGAAINARTDRITKETLYGQMRGMSSTQLETFPLIMSNALIQALRARIADLQGQQAKLSESLGDKHPDMVRLRTEIEATEAKLRQEMQNIIKSVESDYRTAAQQEANLAANLETTKQEALELNRKAIDYNVLKRDVEANQQLYRELMSRTKESGLESELTTNNIRILEKAEMPRAPISPQRMRNYQMALLIGFGLGIGLCVLFEHLDNTFKTPEDVKEHLGVPFLGMVPDVSGQQRPAARGAKTGVPPPKNAQSAVAEAYRVLRTNLIFSSTSSSGQALLVSSANPGEGKTTTVANLAESLAQNGARVLAVDADLRRPTLHQHFGAQKTPGLSDLIVGKSQASQVIQSTRIKGLQILPCGYIPPNPTELLGSANMREVVRALREHYDWVLIDAPPILAIADAPVLCPIVDGLVLVVGAEMSSRPAVQRAIEQIRSVGAKITGVVLNKVDLERNSYYYGQYYGEYYRSYYAEGGTSAPVRPATGPRPLRRS